MDKFEPKNSDSLKESVQETQNSNSLEEKIEESNK
jgi:hypothetical protein